LLLGLLLFNWFGYRLLVGYLQEQNRKALELSLDESNYDESQLISIKTQVTHLSYYNASDQFERVDGSIEVDGVRYKYVKRRLFKDSAELLCIPDHAAMGLQSFNNNFFHFISGIQAPVKRHGANSLPVKMTMADPYVVEGQALTPWNPAIYPAKNSRYTFLFPPSPDSAPERPPAANIL
jgi:hypothetical protein